jgi:3-hydroxybutyryl-CoA dehydrogenase
MSYKFPSDVDERPVAIDGAGTLGRRIAAMYAAGGTDVRVFDLSEEQRQAAQHYASDQAEELRGEAEPSRHVEASDELGAAVRRAWMVIEAVPEKLELKREVFGELDRLADPDAILASNSSFDSDEPGHRRRAAPGAGPEHSPPAAARAALRRADVGWQDRRGDHRRLDAEAAAVRLRAVPRASGERRLHLQPRLGSDQARMSDGRRGGSRSTRGRRPDVADLHGSGYPPFHLMDQVGLDVVLNIEEHYAEVRAALAEGPRKLLRKHIEEGRLGVKSGRGFYEY